MPNPLILYSTNTWLSYAISQRYYGGSHYVWCSPFRGPGSMATFENTVPPSSSPIEIYVLLRRDVAGADSHSAKIRDNKVGLLRGASIRKERGEIDEETEKEIAAIIDQSSKTDFRPLLYVIPFSAVASSLTKVPVERRAHPLSDEYIVEDLRTGSFDVLEFPV